MALINCPECKKEVSDKALSCPNCGCPIVTQELSTSTSNAIECPKCHSTQTVVQKRGVDAKVASDACCLSIIFGPFALLCAAPQANETQIACLKCGHKWEPSSQLKPDKKSKDNCPYCGQKRSSVDDKFCFHCQRHLG